MKILLYFKTFDEKTPRGFMVVKDVEVSPITEMDDRPFAFSVESFNPPKKLFFSGETIHETESWR